MRMTKLSEFLQYFSSIHYRQPESPGKSWVFWTQQTSIYDRDGPGLIHERVKDAFSDLIGKLGLVCQFWAPVTKGGIQLLSTSDQPFVVRDLFEEFAKYRSDCAKYLYVIDSNRHHIEQDDMIRCGGPATAFLNRLPYIEDLVGSPFESNPDGNRWPFSIMLPICFPSQSYCVGVVECSGGCWCHDLGAFVFDMKIALQKVGLDVFNVERRIPYQAITGLNSAKTQINDALRIIFRSHDLILAQVWITVQSSSVEDMKRIFMLKLTGYIKDEHSKRERECNVSRDHYCYPNEEPQEPDFHDFWQYYNLCGMIPQQTAKQLAFKTLQDYKPRYSSKLPDDMLIEWKQDCCALAICLSCIDTGDYNYGFEFIWLNHSNTVILLEDLLLALRRYLPRFKFSSGAELGDELDIIDVGGSKDGETSNFKIFQGKRSSSLQRPSKEGNIPKAADLGAPLRVRYRNSASTQITREAIEKQYGKTKKEAAETFGVSLSTFRNMCRALGITEWPKINSVKTKAIDKSIFQIDTVDEKTIQELSTESINKNSIKEADHADDMFHLLSSQETFASDSGKIFEGEISSPAPSASESEGKKPMAVDYIPPLAVTYKTAPKHLPQEVIEKQFGKTMNEAAKNLNVSLSTLKNRCRALGIAKWPRINSIQGPSTENINRNTQATKAADHADDMFHPLTSEETFASDNGKTSQGERLLPAPRASEEGKKPMVVDYIPPSKVTYKTAPKHLPREVIEKQFGLTMKDAAENLGVSLSTLKNKWRALGISSEWPGPNVVRKKANDLFIMQMDTEEEGAIQEPSTKDIHENTRAIKAGDHANDMFRPAISQETFVTDNVTISQGTISSPVSRALEEGKKPTVVDNVSRLQNIYLKKSLRNKTAPILLPRELIEKQFGKTMSEAAKNLQVSSTTLKRKLALLGIPEWPGPSFMRRKANDSSIIQANTSEEYNVAFQESSTVNINKDTQPISLGQEDVDKQFAKTMEHKCTNDDDNGAIQGPSSVNIDTSILTIKAENVDDMIKFHLPISQLTFATLEKQIGLKFKLSHGTYKLKYLDEDGDWISLTSDEEISDCIKSSRKTNRTVIRLRVLPCTQLVSCSSSS